LEIEVTAIHYIDRAWLRDKLVKDFYVMHLSIGYGDERGDVTA